MGMYVCERCIRKYDLEIDERDLHVHGMCELCRAKMGTPQIEATPTRWVTAPHRNSRLPVVELWEDYRIQLVRLADSRRIPVRASDGTPLKDLQYHEIPYPEELFVRLAMLSPKAPDTVCEEDDDL